MMADPQPRYEYRIWADKLENLRLENLRLENLRNDLQRLTLTTVDEHVNDEIYLISAATDACNAKIRHRRLNVKVLIGEECGLELWKPILDAGFPLDRSVLAAQLFPYFKLQVPELRQPRYSLDSFFRDIIRAQPQIAVMTTVKRRTRFQLDRCLAEFTSVVVCGIARKTVAVESIEPDPVWQLIRQLQIDSMPNTSYIRLLRQVLDNDTSIADQSP
jgi:hypothetical protein